MKKIRRARAKKWMTNGVTKAEFAAAQVSSFEYHGSLRFNKSDELDVGRPQLTAKLEPRLLGGRTWLAYIEENGYKAYAIGHLEAGKNGRLFLSRISEPIPDRLKAPGSPLRTLPVKVVLKCIDKCVAEPELPLLPFLREEEGEKMTDLIVKKLVEISIQEREGGEARVFSNQADADRWIAVYKIVSGFGVAPEIRGRITEEIIRTRVQLIDALVEKGWRG